MQMPYPPSGCPYCGATDPRGLHYHEVDAEGSPYPGVSARCGQCAGIWDVNQWDGRVRRIARADEFPELRAWLRDQQSNRE